MSLDVTLKAMPGQLVYCRDMFSSIKCNADWAITEKQNHININDSNQKQKIPHEYKTGIKYYCKSRYLRSVHHILVPMKSKEFLRMEQL